MLTGRIYLTLIATGAVISCAALAAACSSDDTTTNTAINPEAGTGTQTDSGPPILPPGDGGTVAIDPAVTTAAAALITINPSLPFVAKSIHNASGTVLGAHWGNHGGPLVTSVSTANVQTVTRFTVTGTTDGATSTSLTATNPDGLPAAGSAFFGGDGFIDLPFDDLALQSYTTSDALSSGEVFLYSKNYDMVVARADANGFFSGRGITDGTKTRLVYAGQSDFSDSNVTTDDNGLWAADVTATSLEGASSLKLFAWDGFSGPVTTDKDGNVFVAASISGGTHSDEIYAITKTQALSVATVTQATVIDADTQGTASIAVGGGWVFAKGYDGVAPAPPASVYARAYTATATAIASSGDVVTDAIKPIGTNAVTVFGSPDGNLWVAVKGTSNGYFIELAPK